MAIPRSVLAHWSTVKVIFRSDVIFLLKLLASTRSYLIHPHFIFQVIVIVMKTVRMVLFAGPVLLERKHGPGDVLV